MGQQFTFDQTEFMAKWSHRDKQPDPGRTAVINEGACTAFSALFAKQLQIRATTMQSIDQQFCQYLYEYFRRNADKIIQCQEMGKEIHASSGKGYDLVLSLVDLQPAGEMVKVSSQMFNIGSVQACLHVFTVSFLPLAKHTIVHIVSRGLVGTFDPNDGLWVTDQDDWNSFIIGFLAFKYRVATESSFLPLKMI